MIIEATADQTRTTLLPIVAVLEPHKPRRAPKFIPLAVRVAHKPRHAVTAKVSLLRWAHSRLREMGEGLLGSFFILAD